MFLDDVVDFLSGSGPAFEPSFCDYPALHLFDTGRDVDETCRCLAALSVALTSVLTPSPLADTTPIAMRAGCTEVLAVFHRLRPI